MVLENAKQHKARVAQSVVAPVLWAGGRRFDHALEHIFFAFVEHRKMIFSS